MRSLFRGRRKKTVARDELFELEVWGEPREGHTVRSTWVWLGGWKWVPMHPSFGPEPVVEAVRDVLIIEPDNVFATRVHAQLAQPCSWFDEDPDA